MSTQSVVNSDLLEQTCASTPEVEARKCRTCGEPIPQKMRKGTKYCSRDCQNNTARDMEAQLMREVKQVAKNLAYKYLHRDQSIGWDGRYEGPLNKSVTIVMSLKRDGGYHPMPIDVHVEAAKPRFTQVTPEDVDWGKKQGSMKHGLHVPKTNYCPNCHQEVDEIVCVIKREVRWLNSYGNNEKKIKTQVVDRVVYKKQKRLVKGKYVLQSHVCGER